MRRGGALLATPGGAASGSPPERVEDEFEDEDDYREGRERILNFGV